MIVFFIYGNTTLSQAQDSLTIKADSISKSQSKIEYWKKDAYQGIPKDTLYAADTLNAKAFQQINKKYRSNEFNYEEDKIDRLSFWDRLSRRISQFFESLFPNWTKKTGDTLLYLLIFLGIAAIVFTVYRIVFSKNKIFLKEKKEASGTQVDFIERNLESIDIDHYINQALQEKEWNLAIRYLHLANLQLLARKGLIEWDYRKTNQDFLAELKTESLKNGFQKTTDTFNYVWFGGFELDKERFEQLQQDFIHFKNEIRWNQTSN